MDTCTRIVYIVQLYNIIVIVVVVYHITIVAIEHGFVEEILAFGTRLHSTHCREFNYLKLCSPAYFVRTTQLLPYPGHK